MEDIILENREKVQLSFHPFVQLSDYPPPLVVSHTPISDSQSPEAGPENSAANP